MGTQGSSTELIVWMTTNSSFLVFALSSHSKIFFFFFFLTWRVSLPRLTGSRQGAKSYCTGFYTWAACYSVQETTKQTQTWHLLLVPTMSCHETVNCEGYSPFFWCFEGAVGGDSPLRPLVPMMEIGPGTLKLSRVRQKHRAHALYLNQSLCQTRFLNKQTNK